MYKLMSIERNFPDFRKELQEVVSAGSGERSNDAFYAAFDFISENPSDPHLMNIDINELAEEDLDLAQKFKNGELMEEEVDARLKHLPDGSPSSNFLAALRNKLTVKEGWKRRGERKLQEHRQNDTV